MPIEKPYCKLSKRELKHYWIKHATYEEKETIYSELLLDSQKEGFSPAEKGLLSLVKELRTN